MSADSAALTITRVMNACTLIEIGEHRVLTDPFFASPPLFCTERAPIEVADLPPLTAILGCHKAFDLWQLKGFARYRHDLDAVRVFVPMAAMAQKARAVGFSDVEVVGWGEQREVVPGLGLEVVEGHEVVGMVVNNYVLRLGGLSVFFGSEARESGPLEAYRRRRGPVDVAILPSNAVHLFGFVKLVMGGAEAVAATRLLGARTLFVVHDAHRAFPPLVSVRSSGDAADAAAAHGDPVEVVRQPVGVPWSLAAPGA